MKRCPNPACASMQFPDEANFCPSCAQRLVPAEDGAASDAGDDRLGGRFVLGPRIGGHRTGEIYAATDTQTQAECVVKFVHDAVFPTPLLRQRSERELKQLERVQAATVARVLAHGKRGDQLWVAVEKVDGQPLKALVSQGVLPVERARAILLAIGDALSEAAKVGVIHRDVSPKNVLVGPGDAVKVINFGIPTPLKDKVQGEPEFLSPEQVEGKPVDQRSNIYSLGAIFYYMLVGQPPYIGDADAVMQAHLQGDLVPPSQRGTVPPAVEAIIVKALDRVSSKRYMTLRQLLTEVERVDVAGGGKPAASAAKGPAKTMLGMFAPSIGAVGADGKPTEPVLMNPQATGADAPGAVATFAPPTGPVAAPPQAAPPQAGQAAAEPAPPQAAPPQAGQAAAEPA
ncbi:MAG: serine/threonine protein kinase, partial [Deltaproteobacteria bacterium]